MHASQTVPLNQDEETEAQRKEMDVASVTHNVTSPELDASWMSPTVPGSELPPMEPSQGAGPGCSQEPGKKAGAWLRVEWMLGTCEALGSTQEIKWKYRSGRC